MNAWDFFNAILPIRQKDDSIEVAEVAALEHSRPYGHGPLWRGLTPYTGRPSWSDGYRELRGRHNADIAALWTAALGGGSRSWFWWHGEMGFRAGRQHPEVDAALAACREGSVSLVPRPLVRIREGYRQRNPWRLDREWKEMESLPDSGGLLCSFLLDEWRRRVRSETCDTTDPTPLVNGGGASSREFLRKVVERPLALKPGEAHFAFRLQQAARAPLVAFELRKGEPVHAVASLGAGKLLRLVACTFPSETPQVGVWIDGAYDYGDLRVWALLSTDEALDGTPGAAVLRRRAADAAARLQQYGDVDDDDDDVGRAGWPSTTGNPSGGGRDNA